MRLNGRTITDDDIVIDVQKAVDAFEHFKEVRGPRRTGTKGGDPAFDLDKAIRERLEIFEVEVPKTGMILASKQTLSKWKLDPPKEQIKRKRSVLLAVLMVTGRDTSAHGIIARQPLNLTRLAELTALNSRRVTNDPDEVDDVIFEVEVPFLLFKAAEETVMSDWIIGSNGKAKKGEVHEVGAVVYGLREADVRIDFGETETTSWNRRISPETDQFDGRASGCVGVWSEERNAWVVQPLEGSPMRVHIENWKLCTTRGKRGAFVDIIVSASEDQFYSDFQMRTRGSRDEPLAQADIDCARERLFSIVLAHRRDDWSVLSYQRHKLP